ncbi:MAG TPA: hypothetical protein PKD23_04205 [Bellilinea sp.]|nr:hypothetical protein [Bellilinea sp.]
MKASISSMADGMVWGSIPILAGLFYWEHGLSLDTSGHTLAQIVLLLMVCGWAYFWNAQGEYNRLRHLEGCGLTKTKLNARLITGSNAATDPAHLAENPIRISETRPQGAIIDQHITEKPPHQGIEGFHYVSNN